MVDEKEEETFGFGFNETECTKKKKTKNKNAGSFEAMGLSVPTLKSIKKRGYKVPTPIQRKTIPLILEGRDVVAMARTGSGKTACFLIPIFEKFQAKMSQGSRVLILSPTRELALQTFKFIRELGKFSNLKSSIILGGESMDEQFSTIHSNPDILVATPGRFLHICVEMELKLSSIEYIVFDEADRLFEMGFGEQLNDIVNRLPDARQTLLFSATMPKVLVEFAKAGLNDPILLRLDVETKIPDTLSLSFLCCRPEEKPAALLTLLRNLIQNDTQTIIFAATKHHIEYLNMLLNKAGISNTFIFSNLDPSARKINTAKFHNKNVSVLLVTDLAARGIDIPHLDNVINFNFPAKSKLFVHRVGRCARAGRTGSAYSLISPEEYPYLLDLHLFLGRPLNFNPNESKEFAIGRIPQQLIEEEHSQILLWHNDADLDAMTSVCENGYRKYLRSRPGASVESVRRVKEVNFKNLKYHPIFDFISKDEEIKLNFIQQMKTYKPKETVFEIGVTKSDSVMQTTRDNHKNARQNFLDRKKRPHPPDETANLEERTQLEQCEMNDLKDTFNSIIEPKRYNIETLYKPKKKKYHSTVDKEHFVPYMSKDHHTETGLKVNNFDREASKAEMTLTADSEETFNLQKQIKKWDRKKMKIVTTEGVRAGKIRTESGAWIPKTYKTNRYAQWKENAKIDQQEDDSGDENAQHTKKNTGNTHWARHNRKVKINTTRKGRREMKDADQILKSRAIKQKNRNRSKRKKDRR